MLDVLRCVTARRHGNARHVGLCYRNAFVKLIRGSCYFNFVTPEYFTTLRTPLRPAVTSISETRRTRRRLPS
jgi:hypothetical protein